MPTANVLPSRFEASMFRASSSLAGALVAALFLLAPSVALAQPANDTCAGAVDLSPTGPFPLVPPAVDVTAATVDVPQPAMPSGCTSSTMPYSIWYTFTPAASGVYRFETCSGNGATSTITDTVVALFTGTCGGLTAVANACNDDASGACSLKSAVQVALTAGTTYYLEVAKYGTSAPTAGANTLQVSVSYAPQSPNDACLGAVAIPAGTYPAVSAATDLAGFTMDGDPTISCATKTAAWAGWYSFTPTETSSYRFATCAAETPTTLVDSVLSLYTSSTDCTGTFTAVAGGCNNDASGTCGTQSAVVATLTAGTTYYLLASTPNYSPAVAPASKVAISVNKVQAPANDYCSASSPALSLNTPVTLSTGSTGPLVATAANDSVLSASACFSANGAVGNSTTYLGNGRDVAYAFTAPAGGAYSFRLGAPSISVAPMLYVTDTCTPASTPPTGYTTPQCLGAANRLTSTTTTAQEEVSCLPLTANQTVYVFADEEALSASGASMSLEVNACTREVEPNGVTTTPSALACPVTGSIAPASDVDFYDLGTPAGATTRVFAMAEGAASNSTDFDMRITSATATLEYDDANLDTAMGSLAPVIAGTPLPQGAPAYVRMSHFSGTQSEPYRLYSVLQSGTPQVEVEPNNTAAEANVGSTNYFSGEMSSATDVDFFMFEGKAGDLVFLALDAFPGRTGTYPTSANLNLALVDAAGAVLVSAADGNTSASTTPTTTLTGGTPNSPAEGLVYRLRTTATYFARVTRTGGTLTAPYYLSISSNCVTGGGIAAPAVSSVTPASGSTAGGNSVVISGGPFYAGSTVKFGTAVATVTNRTATALTVTVPAGSPGAVDVTVTTGGVESTTVPGAYTYLTPPTVGTLDVTSGPTSGGTACVLTGSDFQNGATIQLGPNAASNVAFIDSTHLSFVTAPTAKGTYTLTVTNPDGISGFANNAFTFIAPPQLASLSPTHGSTLGGTSVTLNGQDFSATPVVTIDGQVAAATASGTATQLFVTAPANAVPGAKDVTVTNGDGQSATLTGGYTYYRPPTLSSVLPATGATSGGDIVTLTGSSFASGATVTFGTTPAVSVVFIDANTLEVETPGVSPGAVDLTVTNPDGQSSTLTGGFTFVSTFPAPTITNLTPVSGTTHGGTAVTLSGTGIRPGAKVFLDGVVATGLVVNVAAQTVDFVTPAHAFGAVAVRLTNSDNQSDTVAGAFTYLAPPPTLDATPVAPASGPAVGGTAITLTGTEFLSGATVTVGGAACTVTTVTATSITCTTPATTPGAQDLVVTNPDTKSVTATAAFTSIAAPVVTTVAPASGTTLGGETVTLTGTDFRAPVSVELGGVAATNVVLTGTTSIALTTPAHAAGAVAVKVTNGDGQSVTQASAFTYYAPPTLTAVAPVSGPTAGNTTVTLTGTAFRAGAEVLFGTAQATAVTVVSATSITCKSPAMPAGLTAVTVRNVDGQQATLANAFTALAPPSITSVSPATGLTTGGATVTISGADFRTGVTAKFGGVSGTGLVLGSGGTSLTVTTPSRATSGAVDVVVTNSDGQAATLTGGFTYVYPAPTLTAVAPPSGPTAGSTALTLTGTGFLTGVAVKVGGADATSVVRVSATSVTAVTPAGSEGAADVVVLNPDGQSVTMTGGFTYIPPPALTALAPVHGSALGNTTVTFTGAKLTQGASVKIGGVPVFAVAVAANGTSATGITNAHTPGTFDVEWVNPDGQKATLAQAYTFDPAPTLTRLSPTTGSTAGGATVTLTGTGFLTGASVTFDNDAATNVTVVSATEVTAVAPAHAAGIVSVTLRNADGQAAVLPASFRYEAPPTLTSLDPARGPLTGGTAVQLKGTGFAVGATVTFGGVAASHVTLVDATTVSAVTPAHAAGKVDVVVTNPNGAAATLAQAFTYERPAPTLTTLSPSSGPTAGGTALVIRGTGFAAGATVTVGGQAATAVTVVDDGLLRATTPAGTAGAVDVVVTNDDGQKATLAGAFTYLAPVDTGVGQVQDGGTGGLQTPDAGTDPGSLSGGGCGCTAVDPSALGLAGFAALALLSRRRRR